MRKLLGLLSLLLLSVVTHAQINTDRVLTIGRNALYFEDYVLSIQYFNQVIQAKPYLYEPYLFRGIAKAMLEDFKGAEEDCTLALERNPFVISAYSCRAYARQKQGNFVGAIADYEKGLELNNDDKQLWMNKGIAYAQNKEYDKAEENFSHLLTLHPSFLPAHLNRGVMYLERGDTIAALQDIDTVLKMDKYASRAYALRGLIEAKRTHYKEALVDLNEAIRLEPRNTDYYINRALVRYHLNDLRGSMKDYDTALEYEPFNIIASFNRGLLRSYVGDYNRALKDFDQVIDLEPDNDIAIYNRALVRTEVGEVEAAIDDYTTIIDRYPNFLPAYYARSEAKRKGLDYAGAEDDYSLAMKLEYDERMKKERGIVDSTEAKGEREVSDKNIRKFNRLVVTDMDDEREKNYTSQYRGKVQNRNTEIDLLSSFYFSYYKSESDFYQKVDYYTGDIARMNEANKLSAYLLMTNEDIALTSEQISDRFASIDHYSARIGADSSDMYAYLGRSVDFMLIQDLESALKDCEKVLALDTANVVALVNRVYIMDKELEYADYVKKEEQSLTDFSINLTPAGGGKKPSFSDNKKKTSTSASSANTGNRIERTLMLKDFARVLQADPRFYIAYYNRGNIYCRLKEYQLAIDDYSRAIEQEPDFAEAYFNRGLAYILQGKSDKAISDLSKAGEKGIAEAYNVIKRYSE